LVCPENPLHSYHIVMAMAGHSHIFVFVLVGFFMLKRLPWLIAAFRVATARDDDKAKRARKALKAIDPHWHWIWQKRG
jgi:hypothetical protein